MAAAIFRSGFGGGLGEEINARRLHRGSSSDCGRASNHRSISVAAPAPSSWATTNPAASAGRMPVNVSVRALASVTAGLAKEVEAVNQYAAVM